ncbi:MAG: LPS export ABC transporter periplasmic protein LptC [Nitrosomonadaceae bacterium]|nr:LPS export ABC transporter periplasmic protein LptC [Nitrosomonadaceae bacterium]
MIKQFPARLAALPKLPLALLILLAAATFWLDKVVRPPVIVESSGLHRDPDYMLEGLSVIRTDQDGVARYKLFAKKMLHYSDDDSTHLEQPRLVNATPGKPAVQIKADQGELPSGNDEVYLSGNVTLSRNAGNGSNKATMVTSSLRIIPDDDIARTDKAVTITEGNTTINAVGMELDNRANVTRLLSQVKVVHDKKR